MSVPPRVSVIIPTYNWSSVLRHAISSALDQTFADFELLVVGDGCTDDSAEVVAGFGDPRVRWINLEENHGSQWAPNNRGLEEARGEMIAYLGHDDLWVPGHLKALVATLDAHAGSVAAHSMALMVGAPDCGGHAAGGVFPGGYEAGRYFPPTVLLHRRDAAEALDGSPWRDGATLQRTTDCDFISRLAEAGGGFAWCPEVTALKFPASWRPGSYKEKRDQEQASHLARLRDDPRHLEKQLHAALVSYEAMLPVSRVHYDYANLWRAKGGISQAFRVARGLEEAAPDGSAPRIAEPRPHVGATLEAYIERREKEAGTRIAEQHADLESELRRRITEGEEKLAAAHADVRRLREEKNRKRDQIARLRRKLGEG